MAKKGEELMNVEILEKTSSKLKIRVKGETHTLLNLIVKEGEENPDIEFIGYYVPHPLKDEAELTIKTRGKEPMETLREELEKTSKKFEELRKKLREALMINIRGKENENTNVNS